MNDNGSFFDLINYLLNNLGNQIQDLGLEKVSLNEDAYNVLAKIFLGEYEKEKEENDEYGNEGFEKPE